MILEGFFRLFKGAGVPRGMAGGRRRNHRTLFPGTEMHDSIPAFEVYYASAL